MIVAKSSEWRLKEVAHFARNKTIEDITFSAKEGKIIQKDTSSENNKNGPSGENKITLTSSSVSGFNFDLDSMKVAEYTSDLLDLIDLTIRKSGMLDYKLIVFDKRLAYDEKERKKFYDIITKKDGYLDNNKNYFELPKEILQVGSNAMCIRNSRVLLRWRNIQLTDVQKRRILSLGFAYLLGIISQADLIFWIRETIPLNIHEVNVRYKTNTFVLISIEEPIFRS